MRSPILAIALLAACVDPDVGRDRDNDGFQTWELGGDDCDDANAAVNPSASEACGNNIDDDCDGFIDDAGIGQVDWYLDADGDGYPSPQVHSGCSPPEGSFADLTRGVDCNDDEPRSFPGNPETYYDGIDGDCLGGDDYDADRDGYASADHGGDDCDDTEVAVNPGSTEICNNGVDDDCDGGPGPCEYRGTYDIEDVATVTLPLRLWDVASADLDGDGTTEHVILVRPEDAEDIWRARIYSDAVGEPVMTLTDTRQLVGFGSGLLGHVSVDGDFDGDGLPDPLVWSEDEVRIWTGGTTDEVTHRALPGETGSTISWVAVVDSSEDSGADSLAVFFHDAQATPDYVESLITRTLWANTTVLAEGTQSRVPTWRVRGGPRVIPDDGTAVPIVTIEPDAPSLYGTHLQQVFVLGSEPPLAFVPSSTANRTVLPEDAFLFLRADVQEGGPGEYFVSSWGRIPAFPVDGVVQSLRVDYVSTPPIVYDMPSLIDRTVQTPDVPRAARLSRQYCDVNLDGYVDAVQVNVIGNDVSSYSTSEVAIFYGEAIGLTERSEPDASFSLPASEEIATVRCGSAVPGTLWVGIQDLTHRVMLISP